jgi:outer membrane scaffolding protein for murein synthesis (MipA/OmpV family)
VRIGAGAEWGNSKNMQTWFGITPEQAANSAAHLPAYQISSGLRSVSATVAWNYRFNARWGISTMLGVQTLPGDAGDSPIVERRTAAFSSVVMTYAF